MLAGAALLQGFVASAFGHLGVALAAVSVALLVATPAICGPRRERLELLLGLFLLVLAAAAVRASPTELPTPVWLAVPIVAWTRHVAARAWLWSGAAVCVLVGVPTVRSFARAADGAAFDLPATQLLLATGLLVVAGVAFLFRERIDSLEARLRSERELRERAEEARLGPALLVSEVATVSHELRTPLAGILGLLDLVLARPLARTDREQLGWARNTAEFMASLVDDLVDRDRLEHGRLVARIRPFEVREVCADVFRLLEPRSRAKGLSFKIAVDSKVEAFLLGDGRRVRQILLNLVGNAIKFTRSGEIDVRVARLGANAKLVRFEVRDTGPGIAGGDTERLFERYERGVAQSDRIFPSSGLGLAISRDLARALGGVIGVVSVPGQGSLFWLEIPLEACDSRPPTPTPPAALAVGAVPVPRGRILVADDDPPSREVVARQLGALGFETEVVDCGEAVLDWVGRERFDAIVLDFHMPGLGGLETARLVRERELQGQHLLVVGLTASAGGHDRGLLAGMDSCLRKPVAIDELFAVLEAGLGTSGSLPEPLLDRDRLAELAALGSRVGEHVVAELAHSFAVRAPALVAALELALAGGDRAEAQQLAHTLVGTASNLGATAVAVLAAELETSLVSGLGAVDPAAVAALASTTTATCRVLAAEALARNGS